MVRVAILHPDLGLGGAERLVVDVGLALLKRGHKVHIITAHHDPSHCFVETRDGTLPVTVVGDWILPTNIFGYGHAICAFIRMMIVALYLVLYSDINPDVIFCDQVSACIPILRKYNLPVVFYCHFPDMLLAQRNNILRSLYRKPLDWLEEWTTGMADIIFVNSKFTANIFAMTFKNIKKKPTVLYPSLNTSAFDREPTNTLAEVLGKTLPDNTYVMLSLNRYERKKNIKIAIEALYHLRYAFDHEKCQYYKAPPLHLVIAGGYDHRCKENVQHFEELETLANELKVSQHITFLRSPDDDAKLVLLKKSSVLLYTPPNEHFGIVPLEAMYVGLPVIAVNSGGPVETVVDLGTGMLRSDSGHEFAAAVFKMIDVKDLTEQFGKAGREHVKTNFSFELFMSKVDRAIVSLARHEQRQQ